MTKQQELIPHLFRTEYRKIVAVLCRHFGFDHIEIADAGIFFNMTGAAISHVVSGSAEWHVFYTGFLAVLALASWALRPQSRTLGVLFPTKMAA